MRAFATTAIVVLCTATQVAHGAMTNLEIAQELFARYVRGYENYDPRTQDLYANTALIEIVRTTDGKSPEVQRTDGATYKAMFDIFMPRMRAARDRSTYSDVTYTDSGDKVVIKGTRKSLLMGYSSKIYIEVADRDGSWLIVHEITEVKK